MRYALIASVVLIQGVYVVGASVTSSLLTLWPAQLDGSLIHDHMQDGGWSVRAAHEKGSLLGAAASTLELPLTTPWHALLDTIEITWTPPCDSETTTFDHLVGASSLPFPGLHTVGVHVRVKTKDSITARSVASLHPSIDRAVRDLLHSAFPSTAAWNESQQQPGFLLAPATLNTSQTPFYTASFAFHALPAHHSSAIERALQRDRISTPSDATIRVVRAAFQAKSTNTAHVELLTVWQSAPSTVVSTSDDREAVVVTSIARTSATTLALSTSSKDTSKSGTTTIHHVTRVQPATLNVSIEGEGFHRRVHIHARPPSWPSGQCNTLQVFVPLSASVYADLDELRRMERFGAFRLYSVSKHIEIERPSAVSSQHAIVLEYTIDHTQPHMSIMFPIHFRYQSPSFSAFFTPATMLTPELAVVCTEQPRPETTTTHSATPLDAWNRFVSTWLTTSTPPTTIRLIPSTPLRGHDVAIPVGFTPHGPLVSATTLSVTALGALVLVYVAITSSTETHTKQLDTATWRPSKHD